MSRFRRPELTPPTTRTAARHGRFDARNSILPLYELTCNGCGGEFLTAIPVLWKNKGKVTCANCGEAGYYVLSDLRGFSLSKARISEAGPENRTGIPDLTRFRRGLSR
jgi:hypothetical protein